MFERARFRVVAERASDPSAPRRSSRARSHGSTRSGPARPWRAATRGCPGAVGHTHLGAPAAPYTCHAGPIRWLDRVFAA
jgi:hypothetical protein